MVVLALAPDRQPSIAGAGPNGSPSCGDADQVAEWSGVERDPRHLSPHPIKVREGLLARFYQNGERADSMVATSHFRG